MTIPAQPSAREAAGIVGWLDEAAARGFCAFPCLPGGKRPAVDRWEQRALCDAGRLVRYWPSPAHNIGIACGPSRLVVLDLDCHGDLPQEWQALPGVRTGHDVLAQLCEWAGQPWPSTYMVATPSGGWHLYYRAPGGAEIRNSASLLGPQVDVRASGGYVVGAGSVTPVGRYELLDAAEPASLPEWIRRMLARPDPPPRSPAGAAGACGRLDGLVHAVATAAEGSRNQVLYWAACRAAEMAAEGQVGAEAAAAFLRAAAADAGLGEAEARRTVASAMGGGR